MKLEEYYQQFINNIYKAETAYEILSNVDNLNYINAISSQQRRRLFKNGTKMV